MRSVVCLMSLCMVLASGGDLTQAAPSREVTVSAPRVEAQSRPGWRLVWSDEFDREGRPDPAKWTYETGFVRNQEEQYYTHDRPENARVQNGVLVIEGRKELLTVAADEDGPADGRRRIPVAHYTSASLTTEGKASWTFGRVEVRAKLPQGMGVWPAIWMMGVNRGQIGWPRCGEIDIMEFVGKTPGKVHATVHFGPDGKHLSQGDKLSVDKPWENFHVYAVEWWPDRIDFFYDDTRYFTFDIAKADGPDSNAFRQPHYLLLNLALGGSWGGKIDDRNLPQRMEVDYVRVYRHASLPASAATAPTTQPARR